MAERKRIKWDGEKKVYQPRIKADRIKDLYNMREHVNLPMTAMVDEALERYILDFYNMILEPEIPIETQETSFMLSDDLQDLLLNMDEYAGETTTERHQA